MEIPSKYELQDEGFDAVSQRILHALGTTIDASFNDYLCGSINDQFSQKSVNVNEINTCGSISDSSIESIEMLKPQEKKESRISKLINMMNCFRESGRNYEMESFARSEAERRVGIIYTPAFRVQSQ